MMFKTWSPFPGAAYVSTEDGAERWLVILNGYSLLDSSLSYPVLTTDCLHWRSRLPFPWVCKQPCGGFKGFHLIFLDLVNFLVILNTSLCFWLHFCPWTFPPRSHPALRLNQHPCTGDSAPGHSNSRRVLLAAPLSLAIFVSVHLLVSASPQLYLGSPLWAVSIRLPCHLRSCRLLPCPAGCAWASAPHLFLVTRNHPPSSVSALVIPASLWLGSARLPSQERSRNFLLLPSFTSLSSSSRTSSTVALKTCGFSHSLLRPAASVSTRLKTGGKCHSLCPTHPRQPEAETLGLGLSQVDARASKGFWHLLKFANHALLVGLFSGWPTFTLPEGVC